MTTARSKKMALFIGIALVCSIVISALYSTRAFNRLELITFDLMSRIHRTDTTTHEDIVVILIDESSLKALNPIVGRWPWPRFVYAEMMDYLLKGEPAAIAFDILFTENEFSESGGLLDSDMFLVDMTSFGGNVYHAYQLVKDIEDEYNKNLLDNPLPQWLRERFALKGLKPQMRSKANNYYLPFTELAEASYGLGIVEFSPDMDGVFRRTAPLRSYMDDYFPVMGLAPVLDVLGIEEIKFDRKALWLDDLKIPLGSDGQYLINMYANYNTFSAGGILASIQSLADGDIENLIVSPEEFKDKIIYIGASAAGIEDLKPTSLSNNTPGVFLHASLASNLLNGDFLVPPKPLATVFIVFLLSFISSGSVLLLNRMTLKVALPLGAGGLYILFAIFQFRGNYVYEIITPIIGIVVSFIAAFVYLSLTEGREKRKVRRMLGQYVSPHMLSEIENSIEDVLKAKVGTKEKVTVLFSDIRGFTSISENEPAERIVKMLNMYFSSWSDSIFEEDGMIDKFVGDAVMALWGAPLKRDDHALRAVRAAMGMLSKLPELNEKLKESGYPQLKIGVGINTGEAILGNIGSERCRTSEPHGIKQRQKINSRIKCKKRND